MACSSPPLSGILMMYYHSMTTHCSWYLALLPPLSLLTMDDDVEPNVSKDGAPNDTVLVINIAIKNSFIRYCTIIRGLVKREMEGGRERERERERETYSFSYQQDPY